jgi:hypothetical protein
VATGALLTAGAITTAAVTLPSTASASSSPAFANLGVATQQRAAGQGQLADDQVRFGLGMRQLAYEQGKEAAEKTAAAKAAAAAAKAAAVKAAAVKAAAAQATAEKAVAAKAQATRAQAHAKAQTQAKIQHQATGSPQQIANAMLGQFGWSGSQFSCLNPLWAHESGWSVSATNAGSGAYGIPQALPGSKMGSAGPGWQTNPATQIRWGLNYIRDTYGSPCAAWSHEESAGWY